MKKATAESSPPNNKHLLQDWLYGGVDLKSRRIFIEGEVNSESVGLYSRGIIKMIEHDDKAPIEVYVNSLGGSVYDGLALYDVIRASGVPIKTYSLGMTMSMGVLLFISGDERFAFSNTTFMCHAISGGVSGKMADVEVEQKEMKRLNDKMIEILSVRTKRSKKWWAKELKFADMFFDLIRGKELGLVTHEIKNFRRLYE